jgi:hypothetical protein
MSAFLKISHSEAPQRTEIQDHTSREGDLIDPSKVRPFQEIWNLGLKHASDETKETLRAMGLLNRQTSCMKVAAYITNHKLLAAITVAVVACSAYFLGQYNINYSLIK